VVCKQGYVPVGVDGSVKGWQEDFLSEIGLSDLAEDDFRRIGGVNGVVLTITSFLQALYANDLFRMANTYLQANSRVLYAQKLPKIWVSQPALL
jgi:hypothetical protein